MADAPPAAIVVIAMRSASPGGIWRWPERATVRLRREFPQVEFREYSRPIDAPPCTAAEWAQDAALFADADAVVAWRLAPRLWRDARRLRWIHSPSAAVDQLLTPELRASAIQVTNGAAVHASIVAEHGVALMLALARGLPRMQRDQAAHRWAPLAWLDELTTIAGSTVVLLGLGHIGRALAPKLATLGVEVIGVRQHADGLAPGCAEVHAVAALHALLPRAAWLVLALPATPSTADLIGARELALLAPGARVVNLGRGAALNEAALAAALAAGRLAGAALDVFAAEPLPPSSPLWSAPGCLISPHVAASTPDSWDRQADLIAAHLRRFLAGEPLAPLVDKHRGY